MASLNRFVINEGTQTNRNNDLRVGDFNCSDLSGLISFVKNREKKQNKPKISNDVIKALQLCLNNPIVEIR